MRVVLELPSRRIRVSLELQYGCVCLSQPRLQCKIDDWPHVAIGWIIYDGFRKGELGDYGRDEYPGQSQSRAEKTSSLPRRDSCFRPDIFLGKPL